MNEGPFSRRDARCALARSLDLARIPRILGGGEVPAAGWVPPALAPGRGRVALSFDVAAAKDLARRGGLAAEHPVELHYYAKDIHTPVMEWAQGQWKKNLGLDVRLVREEGKIYWAHLASSPPALFLSGTTAWFAHPYSFLSELASDSAANWGRYTSRAYDEDTAQAQRDETAPRRAHAVADAKKELLERDCAIVPLYFRNTLMLTATRCTGVTMNPLGTASFTRMSCTP